MGHAALTRQGMGTRAAVRHCGDTTEEEITFTLVHSGAGCKGVDYKARFMAQRWILWLDGRH